MQDRPGQQDGPRCSANENSAQRPEKQAAKVNGVACPDATASKPKQPFILPLGFESKLDALRYVISFGTLLPRALFLDLLFHVERTLCWGKQTDSASSAQMVRGIYRKDKTWIRAGCGLKKRAAIKADQELEKLGILRIRREMKRGRGRGYEVNDYEVVWARLDAYVKEQLYLETKKTYNTAAVAEAAASLVLGRRAS